MKILLVSHPPLAAELGAAQIAINLAEALRGRGHDARAWSPEPLPPDTRWWNLWKRQTEGAERWAEENGPFDVIETPALSASGRLARCCRLLVTRSVQPELGYLWHDVRSDLARPSPRAIATAVLALRRAAAIKAGWRRAGFILCMGSLELDSMRRRFPAWKDKLGLYVCALSARESEALAAVRRGRTVSTASAASAASAAGTRFLWIGRWSAQKGIRPLLRFLRGRLASHPQDTVTIAGCGPAAERHLPREWIRSGRLRLVPAFPRADLPALLAGHDAGLFTSEVEGWGLSLNEMLESGLTVFATEAGAAADLRPYFPGSLRPFPPPPEIVPAPLEDLTANGYYERFSWPAIAASWEEQVLGKMG